MNPPHLTLRDVLNAYKSGDLSLRDAEEEIQGLQIEELGDIARIDTGRTVRCGIPEVVLGGRKKPRPPDRDYSYPGQEDREMYCNTSTGGCR